MRSDSSRTAIAISSNGKGRAASKRGHEDAETAAKEYGRTIFKNLHDAIFIHDLGDRRR